MKRVVLDSNIYISALNFGGQPIQAVDLSVEGQIELAISEPLTADIVRVLRDKFLWAESEIEDVLKLIRGIAKAVEPLQTLDIIKTDPDDNRVLECAVTATSEVIVTGDTDLLSLKTYAGIKIMRVAEFLAEFGKPSEP